MTLSTQAKSRLGTALFIATLALSALSFRRELRAWFAPLRPDFAAAPLPSSAPSTKSPPAAPPFAYPRSARDALRSALDALERARAALAADRMHGVPEAGRAVAEATRAAAVGLGHDAPELAQRLSASASAADELARAPSIAAARQSFANLNRHLLPALGADAQLTAGSQVFECPMFEHARWLQHGDKIENPYMGSQMLSCGTPSDFGDTAVDRPSADAVYHYTCSMHPSVQQRTPGKCPICGMDLIPVTRAQQEQGEVLVDAARQQLIGVRIAPVVQGPMRRRFRALGRVAYDESKLTDVSLKVGGYVTRLLVNRTGQRVRRGQPLLQLYSPELYAAQQDFLLAGRGAGLAAGGGSGSETLLGAARQRLHLLGLSEAQIDAVQKRGMPSENVSIPAPASGFVIEKDVVEGAGVQAGMRLYRLAALERVWIEADVYEADLPQVRVGQSAELTLDYLPGERYSAKVREVYPSLNTETRTGRVRLELENRALELRPGMYASVSLGAELSQRLQVPASAVIYTGPRRLVFVALGAGRFRPQEVRVGVEADGMYEVLSGLSAGDQVATSGVFLLAAEARIATAAKYWDSPSADAAPAPSSSGGPP